mmetsp:Transcript_7794/g.16785  ORF Transcript_7794/g.16785 Transcript_7794/m.16785 type:complete len:215 (-) Transcript_7794:242-886(-)
MAAQLTVARPNTRAGQASNDDEEEAWMKLETDGVMQPVTIHTPLAIQDPQSFGRDDSHVQILTFGRCSGRAPVSFLRDLLLSGGSPQRVPDNISDVPTEKSETLSESSPDDLDADDINRIVNMALRDLEDVLSGCQGGVSSKALQPSVTPSSPEWALAARQRVSNNAHNIAMGVVGSMVALYLLRLMRSPRRRASVGRHHNMQAAFAEAAFPFW